MHPINILQGLKADVLKAGAAAYEDWKKRGGESQTEAAIQLAADIYVAMEHERLRIHCGVVSDEQGHAE